MKRFLRLLLFCTAAPVAAFAQDIKADGENALRIYDIQGSGEVSAYEGETVSTEGVVTYVLPSNNMRGFFMQDTLGDGNPATSDGIMVYGMPHEVSIKQGDYIVLTGKVSEYNGRTELSNITDVRKIKSGMEIPYVKVHFPGDVLGKQEQLEGMALEMTDPLIVNSNYSLERRKELTLGSVRHRAPTDYNLPGSDEMKEARQFNNGDQIILSGYYSGDNVPFLDADGTCRNGSYVENLRCVMDQAENYVLYAVEEPEFKGNERTGAPSEKDLTEDGTYDIKVCGTNLENFFNKNALQRTRIIKALTAIDADLYGLLEVGGGSDKIEALISELNKAKGEDVYDFIKYNGYAPSSSYTLIHIVYNKKKLEPYKEFYAINTPTPVNRKLIQGFKHKQTGFVFIYSLNHLKAKSGSGTGLNADQGDGQGIFNYARVQEANAVKNKLDVLKYYYGTDKILVMGDMNAFYREDPIRVFTDAGYVEMNHRFHDNDKYYSYCYGDYMQYLDYALVSPAMDTLFTGATVWHVNADEPAMLDYDKDPTAGSGPYRYSDHDPVVVAFRAVKPAEPVEEVASEAMHSGGALLCVHPNPVSRTLYFTARQEGRAEIRSLSGALLWSGFVHEGETAVNAENWPAGIYFISLQTVSGTASYAKFIVNKY